MMLQLAIKADRAAVNEIARQVHSLHVQWRPDLYCMAEELYSQERFDEAVANRQLYVAKIEGNVVGYALQIIRDFSHNGMVPRRIMVIDEFGVHEAARGHGIGTEMMADLRALAKAFRCTDMKLNVYPQNDGAVRFYERNGFMIRAIDMMTKV